MRHTSKSRNYFVRTLALAMACCIVVFLIQVVIHDHESRQDEAACRVCHAAHMGAAPGISALLLTAPLFPSGCVHESPYSFIKTSSVTILLPAHLLHHKFSKHLKAPVALLYR
jgi:hypothetical protein